MSDSIDEAERAVNEALQDAFDASKVETVLMCNDCARTWDVDKEQCQDEHCASTELFEIELFD